KVEGDASSSSEDQRADVEWAEDSYSMVGVEAFFDPEKPPSQADRFCVIGHLVGERFYDSWSGGYEHDEYFELRGVRDLPDDAAAIEIESESCNIDDAVL